MVAIQKYCTFIKANDAQCNCYRVKGTEFCSFHNQNTQEDRVKLLEQELVEIKKALHIQVEKHEEFVKTTDAKISNLSENVVTYKSKINTQQKYMNFVHFVFFIALVSIVAYLNNLQVSEIIKVMVKCMKVYKNIIKEYVIKYTKIVKVYCIRVYENTDLTKIKRSFDIQLLLK
tara:strand:+ start:1162 stop:1683 length:522 start_codon:yes stop_codon:yes gene_type:complete